MPILGVLVMFMQGADGKVAGPFVTKHWRQDWKFEDGEPLTHRGRLIWERERLTPAAAKGTWTQAVIQVDDSPRYEAFGRWSISATCRRGKAHAPGVRCHAVSIPYGRTTTC